MCGAFDPKFDEVERKRRRSSGLRWLRLGACRSSNFDAVDAGGRAFILKPRDPLLGQIELELVVPGFSRTFDINGNNDGLARSDRSGEIGAGSSIRRDKTAAVILQPSVTEADGICSLLELGIGSGRIGPRCVADVLEAYLKLAD